MLDQSPFLTTATRAKSEQIEVRLRTSPNFFHPPSGAPQLAGPAVGGDDDDCADDNFDHVKMMTIMILGITVCLLVTTTTMRPSGLSKPTI